MKSRYITSEFSDRAAVARIHQLQRDPWVKRCCLVHVDAWIASSCINFIGLAVYIDWRDARGLSGINNWMEITSNSELWPVALVDPMPLSSIDRTGALLGELCKRSLFRYLTCQSITHILRCFWWIINYLTMRSS